MYNYLLKKTFNVYFFSTLFCFLLIATRVYFSGYITFVFLVWNLFLAWIPYLISKYLIHHISDIKKISLFFLGGVWLLFFPNAPYILTDLIHLKPRADVPFWFDLVLLLSFAWTGVLLGYKSLHNIQKIIQQLYGKTKALIFVVFCLFISGYGIYLGRFERFNSWDILTQPFSLLYEIKETILHPFDHFHTYGVTLLFGVFLLIGYFSIFKLKEEVE